MIVSVMGRFKGEDGYCMYMLPLITVNQSGIIIPVWLERLVYLLKSEGRTNCSYFCDKEGYMLSASSIESVFKPIME